MLGRRLKNRRLAVLDTELTSESQREGPPISIGETTFNVFYAYFKCNFCVCVFFLQF